MHGEEEVYQRAGIVNILHWQRLCLADRNSTHLNSWVDKMRQKQSSTSFTGATQVSSPRAVTHVAIPALSADPIVLAGIAQALFGRLFGAGWFDPGSFLDLSQASDIFTLSVNK